MERKVEAAEDEKYSESEGKSDEFGLFELSIWVADSDSDNAITISLGLESNENSIDDDCVLDHDDDINHEPLQMNKYEPYTLLL